MVDILLAAFNGERFIRQQLDSVLAQTETNWRLFIKDDGSTDRTLAIIEEYKENYPDKIFVSVSPQPTGSAMYNFFSMFPLASSDYIFLCDQDDIWLPEKIEKSMEEMHRLETISNKDMPLFVHTDLCVVDETLDMRYPSFFRMQKYCLSKNNFGSALVQNVATGCSVLVNKPLLAMAGSASPEIIMHDWWLYLIAAAFGKVGVVKSPTVLYRQHGANTLGAKKIGENAHSIAGMRASFDRTHRQAVRFRARFSEQLSEKDRQILSAYLDLPNHGKLWRIATVCRYGFWKHSLRRKIGQILSV